MARMQMRWTSWLALIAIVGLLVAVLLPSYGDYTHRAQAAEAVSLLAGAKTPLAEYFENRKHWPARLDEVSGSGGKYTQSVVITKGAGAAGEIELTASMRNEGVDRRVAGHTVLMISADGGKSWTCKPGTMPATNLPEGCRN